MRAKFPQPDGVVLVGKAQEKCTVYRTKKRYNPKTKRAYAWIVKSTALVKQLERGQIAYQALDNGIRSCADPRRLQQICDGLSPAKIDATAINFPLADRNVAYPSAGPSREWQSLLRVVIRENLDLGRPKQMQLIFDRGITKATRIKQYHKAGQALRTETTINNTRDFYFGKSLHNLPALRKIGFQANRRVLQVQTITQDSLLAEQTLRQLQRPRIVEGQRFSALRLADPTVQALWNAVLMFDLLPGFPTSSSACIWPNCWASQRRTSRKAA
jgi:hypothetical protein